MDEGESFVWNVYLAHSWVNSPGLLGQLTWMARLDKLGDVLTKGWPVVVFCHSPGGLLDTRMVQVMDKMDDGAPLTFWDEWAWLGWVRDLADNVNSVDWDRPNRDIPWHQTLEAIRDPLARLLGLGQLCRFEGVHDDLLDGGDCVHRLDVLN